MADEESGSEIVRLRNNFYRDSYRRVLALLLILVITNVVSIGFAVYLFLDRAPPQYFATTTEGKLLPMHPLSEPIVSTAELLQWVTIAAISANTFNFVDYRRELQAASAYFTPSGWKEYLNALESSRNLETVVNKKLTVNAVATGAPIILDEGVINGQYKWKVQLPILITYESASMKISQPVLATMLVTRVPTLDTPKGILIDAFYMSEQAAAAQR